MSLLLALTGSAGGYTITALAGAYVVTGVPAAINYAPAGGYEITAESGSYAVSGKPASITRTSSSIEAYSGGYDLPTGRRKTKKEVYAERVKLGIIKEDIAQKALEVVERAADKPISFEPVYQQDPEKLVRQLMSELRLKVPSSDYTRAIELALRIAEQDEEESLLLLLA